MNDRLNAQQHVGVAGFFKLEAHKVDATGKCIQSRVAADWFPNLITDAGLDGLASSQISQLTNYIHVGSGNTTPSVSDTSMENFVAASSSNQDSQDLHNATGPHWRGYRFTKRFASGVAAGNLSEVGASSSGNANPGSLWSRALIVDSGGSPTTITVLEDEILDVTYEVRMYATESDIPWSGTIDGVSSSGVFRLAYNNSSNSLRQVDSVFDGEPVTAYDGDIGSSDSGPSGNQGQSGNPQLAGYSAGSFERAASFTWGIDDANFAAGISSFLFIAGTYTNWQMSVDPPIDKDNTKTLTMQWKVSWGRYTP